MGNTVDRENDSGVEDYNADTIARDITFKSYRRSKSAERRMTPSPTARSRSREEGKQKKSLTRANSSRRRPSFKAKRSNSKNNKKILGNGNASFMISDMEVQVDGKKAKLVPRKSVLRKRVTLAYAPQEKTKKSKGTKSRPKDSMKIPATQQLRQSSGMLLGKRNSYETAVSDARKNSAVGQKTDNSQLNRWSNVDFSPKKDSKSKQRPKSTYTNVNNNNNASTTSTAPKSSADPKRHSLGHEMYKEISSELDRLALVSPITDV